MEAWTLYLVIFFINGDAVMFENNKKFLTKQACYQEGLTKSIELLERTVAIIGIPAKGSFSCQEVGLDV